MKRVSVRALFCILVAAAVMYITASPVRASCPSRGNPDPMVLEGTMRYLDIQGGCWVLETVRGERYQLVGEGVSSLYREGLRVVVEVRPARDVVSRCMVGKLVRLIRVISVRTAFLVDPST